jgi:hypothetical protein
MSTQKVINNPKEGKIWMMGGKKFHIPLGYVTTFQWVTVENSASK